MAFLKRNVQRSIVVVIAAILCVPLTSAALDSGADEYRVKAAFLLNFLKFAEWPDGGDLTPFVIGVLLPDPFSAELEQAARSMKVAGRRVEVHRFRKMADVRPCHILFVPRDAEFLPPELPRAGRLTVGETPEFLSAGGTISFYMREKQVRFEIDPAAAQVAGVRISASVLQLGARR